MLYRIEYRNLRCFRESGMWNVNQKSTRGKVYYIFTMENTTSSNVINIDDQTMGQIREIEKDIIRTQSLISEAVSPHTLLEVYQENELPGFIPGIHYLAKKYNSIRRVRGDGNCFYRYIVLPIPSLVNMT
jgi:hypothetical protein